MNRYRLLSELRAAGIDVLAVSVDGDHAGRVVLMDGTTVYEDGSIGHDDDHDPKIAEPDRRKAEEATAATARAVVLAHDPTPDPPRLKASLLVRAFARLGLYGIDSLTVEERNALQTVAGDR